MYKQKKASSGVKTKKRAILTLCFNTVLIQSLNQAALISSYYVAPRLPGNNAVSFHVTKRKTSHAQKLFHPQ